MSSATPAASETIVTGACHASVAALENPKTIANRPVHASTTPTKSIRGRCGCPSLTMSRSAKNTAGMAMSRLTYRHQRQESTSVSRPPSIRPTDAPAVATAEKMPNAFARSGESANVTVSSDSADGASSAPNAPCSVRAITRTSKEGASPPRNDAAEKPIKPAMKVHLRPKRSPIFPPTSSRLPNASA